MYDVRLENGGVKMRREKLFKKLTAVLLSGVLAATLLVGCGSDAGTSTDQTTEESTEEATEETTEEATEEATEETADGDKVIRVGANPVPHADILDNAVAAELEKDGWTLETVVFEDYVLPNTSLEADELDANYFQTLGYLEQQNSDAGLHLAAVTGVHIEPMGIYSEKYTSLDEIPDGAEIGVPNDPDNEERGLNLLVQKGLLNSLGNYATEGATSLEGDKDANPHGYKITSLEAANLPNSLADLDAAAINGNYALGADLPTKHPAIDIEEFDDQSSIQRTNFVVVKQGNENTEKTQALVKAINSDAVKAYIEDKYKGSVIASFIDPA